MKGKKYWLNKILSVIMYLITLLDLSYENMGNGEWCRKDTFQRPREVGSPCRA